MRGYPEWFFVLGQGDVMGVPTQLWLLLLAIVIAWIVLARTTFGRALYAIGHNEVAARFSGLPVDRYKTAIYTFSGFMAGLAGFIFVSRVSTTRSDMGTGLSSTSSPPWCSAAPASSAASAPSPARPSASS